MTDEEITNPEEESGTDVESRATITSGDDDPLCGDRELYRQQKEEEREKREYIISETKEWIKSIGIALVLALIIKTSLIQAYVIPTASMEPTIVPNDRIFGNRLILKLREPRPGDIVAFIPPDEVINKNNDSTSYLKRVVGIPGDVIDVKDGIVYRNGEALYEPYILAKPLYDYTMKDKLDEDQVPIPEGYLFVMGDSRNNSQDSRVWGLLPRKNVQAKAFFRFWPPGRVGVIR